MNLNKTLLILIIGLLLILDFLTFHDVFEPHTVRDWLILVVSILTFVYSAKVLLKKAK